MLYWEITLNRWLYDGIVNRRNVLSIDQDYFLIRSGSSKWLYRIARKHAGSQAAGFSVSLEELHNKSGSKRVYRSWASDMRKRFQTQFSVLGYCFACYTDERGREMVHMIHASQLRQIMQETALDVEARLAPKRQAQSKQLSFDQLGDFWKAEMKKAERRETKRGDILHWHSKAVDALTRLAVDN